MKHINWQLLLVMCLLSLLVLPFMPCGVIKAANTTNAEWYGIITISNNDTVATNVYTTANISTQALIDGGYCNATVTDVAIVNTGGTDIAFMPGVSGNDWCVYVASIDEDSYLSYLLYTGNVTDGKIRYFPADAGMTRADNALLEGAANFSLTISGYIDTNAGADKNLVNKANAIRVYVQGTATYTTPTGFLDAGGGWNNEANGYDDDTGTNSASDFILAGGGWSEYYEATYDSTSIDSVRYWVTTLDPDVDVIDIDGYDGTAWQDIYQGAFTTGAYETQDAEIAGEVTKIRYRFQNNDVANQKAMIHETDFGVDTDAGGNIRAVLNGVAVETAVASGEHDVYVYADSVNLGIDIDAGGATTAALGGFSIPDNGNDWYVATNSSVPYLECYNVTVGGNARQDIEWEYDTTFTDQSGNGMDATPTFRTASSDADVIGWLSAFYPIEEAQAPGYSLTAAPDFITTAPNLTGNFTTTVNATFPGHEVIEAISAASSTPIQLPYHIIFGFVILMGSLCTSWAMRRFGSGSLLVKGFVVLAVMGVAVGVGVYDPWMIIIFVLIAIALAMASRHQAWG